MRLGTLIPAATLAALAGPGLAGGLAPAVEKVEPVVMVEPDAARPSYEILLPLLLVGGLIATASSDDDTNN